MVRDFVVLDRFCAAVEGGRRTTFKLGLRLESVTTCCKRQADCAGVGHHHFTLRSLRALAGCKLVDGLQAGIESRRMC